MFTSGETTSMWNSRIWGQMIIIGLSSSDYVYLAAIRLYNHSTAQQQYYAAARFSQHMHTNKYEDRVTNTQHVCHRCRGGVFFHRAGTFESIVMFGAIMIKLRHLSLYKDKRHCGKDQLNELFIGDELGIK